MNTEDVTLDQYQEFAGVTSVYPGRESWVGLVYAALALSGEAGEVAGKVKKMIRDDNFVLTAERREALADELGDVLWYVASTCEELGYTLGEVAVGNLTKLAGRRLRGTVHGSGDTR